MTRTSVILFVDELGLEAGELLRQAALRLMRGDRDVRIIHAEEIQLPPLPLEVRTKPVAALDDRCRVTAVVEAFATGAEAVAIIGTSALDVPVDFVDLAFDNLSGVRALSIGPSNELIYLVAMNDLFPDIIALAASEKRFDDLLSRASDAGSVAIMPKWPLNNV